jgi:hypothetical protein
MYSSLSQSSEPEYGYLKDKVLLHCEKTFVDSLTENLENQLDEAFKKIQISIFQANTEQEKEVFLNIQETLQRRKKAIFLDFKNYLSVYFKNNIVEENREKKEIAILTDEEEEKFILEKKLEKEIQDKLGEEFFNLNMRMEAVLGEERNPFTPKALIYSLTKTVEKNFGTQKMQAQALSVLGTSLPFQVKTVYKNLNTYLVANDIIPDIHAFQLKKEKNEREKEQESTILIEDLSSFLGSENKESHENVEYFPKINEDLTLTNIPIEKLKNLYENNKNENNSSSSIGVQNDFKNVPKEEYQLNIPNSVELPKVYHKANLQEQQKDLLPHLYKLLTEINTKLDHPLPGAISPLDFSSNLQDSHKESKIDPILEKSIEKIQKRLKEAHSSSEKNIVYQKHNYVEDLLHEENHDLTINYPEQHIILEVLTLVFNKIFNNEKIHDHVKYLISKLQIPIVKVSLLDHKFFMDEKNPVREFLDIIANSTIFYQEEYVQHVEKIINLILEKEMIDQESFVIAIQKLKIIFKLYDKKEQELLEQVRNQLENEEKYNLYYEQILQLISKNTSRAKYEPVKSFIENIWAKSFAKKWVKNYQKDTIDITKNLNIDSKIELHQSLLLFDMMIWTTNLNSMTEANLTQFKNFIIKIELNLKTICENLLIEKEHYKNLHDILVKKHQMLLDGYQANDYLELANIQIDEKITIQKFEKEAEVFHELKSAQKEITESKSNFYEIFIKGKWFEFNHNKEQLKLVWISPEKNIFLFTNPITKKMYRFEKSKIWSYFKAQHLKPIAIEKMFNSKEVIDSAFKEFQDKIFAKQA